MTKEIFDDLRSYPRSRNTKRTTERHDIWMVDIGNWRAGRNKTILVSDVSLSYFCYFVISWFHVPGGGCILFRHGIFPKRIYYEEEKSEERLQWFLTKLSYLRDRESDTRQYNWKILRKGSLLIAVSLRSPTSLFWSGSNECPRFFQFPKGFHAKMIRNKGI